MKLHSSIQSTFSPKFVMFIRKYSLHIYKKEKTFRLIPL